MTRNEREAYKNILLIGMYAIFFFFTVFIFVGGCIYWYDKLFN